MFERKFDGSRVSDGLNTFKEASLISVGAPTVRTTVFNLFYTLLHAFFVLTSVFCFFH